MKKAFVFDFDDTLANTACHVIVRDSSGWPVCSISPAQFNSYKLKDGEIFDFSEFRDEIFIHQANPTFLMHLAKEVYKEGHEIFILTARGNEVSEAIATWLEKHGIKASKVYCVGGTKEIAINKKRVLLDIVDSYDKIYFYDDHEDNVNIYQHEKLRSYLV